MTQQKPTFQEVRNNLFKKAKEQQPKKVAENFQTAEKINIKSIFTLKDVENNKNL